MATATDRSGVVHDLYGNQTGCGQDATGWSRTVTVAQNLGMVVFCPACWPPEYDPAAEAERVADVFDQAATDYATIEDQQ